MHKVFAVIRREFIERVRTRAFVISTILGPVLMGALIFLPVLMAGRSITVRNLVVVDGASGEFGERLTKALSEVKFDSKPEQARFKVVHLLAQNRVTAVSDSLTALIGLSRSTIPGPDGFLVITDSVLESGHVSYFGTNVGSFADMETIGGAVRPVVQTERLMRDHVDTAVVRQATARVSLETAKVTNGKVTGESGASSFWLAYLMTFILYIALLLYGIQVMSSVLEEKTSRIMEILSSSLTPFQLMLGKVIGVGSVGLFQLSIWAGTSLYLTSNLVSILKVMGQSPAAAAKISIPVVSPALLAVFLGFFLLGFFLYAALYAAVGSMCSTQQDTQQAQQPVMLCIVAGFLCMFPVLNDPNGSLARTLSLIPFVAPFVTPLRYSIAPLPPSQLLLSIASTLTGVVVIVWIASRIYRVGILAYGKRPTFKELWGWIRTD